jgi:outer membrane protein OmpA-like peptidoglycan-associated protein/opacity protein-like surface antigen
MKKLYTIIIMSLVTIFVANAQTSDSPWAVSLGANLVSIQDDSVDASTGFGVPSLSLSRYIAGGFSIGAQYSLNSLEIDKIDADYTAIDAILKYNISEGDIFPYLFAGYGLSNFQTDADSEGLFPSSGSGRTYLGGAGVSFFISDNWIVNASTSYRSSTEKGSFNHLQHVVGFSYVFGAQDTDKDGVSDKKDVCPEVPGLKEFEGCPDTDGDGIPDNKDACPEEAGSAELNGCPDSDGDGIADKDDACPDAAGSAEMNGCPDSDGDGLADNVDKCPQEAGEASNNGCPEDDRDGDGVADKDDACPDEAGAVANNGCPELPEKLAAFMQSENSTLLFVVNSSVVTDESSAKLKELTALLAAYSKVNVVIEGHASSDGSMVYNQTLSEKRANSVKDALVGMGVDASRLETVGYGETKPTADNKTAAGRSANRRVQFERKVQIKVVE